MARIHISTRDPKEGRRTLGEKLALTRRLLAYATRRRGMIFGAMLTMLVAGVTETGPIFLAKAFVEQVLFTSKGLETTSEHDGRSVLVTTPDGPRLFKERPERATFDERPLPEARAAQSRGFADEGITARFGAAVTSRLGIDADGRTTSLIAISLLILIVSVFAAAASYWNAFIGVTLASHAVNDIRTDMFEGLMNASIARFSREKTGDLIARFNTDAEQMRSTVGIVIQELFLQPILVVAGIAAAIWVSPVLALCTFLVLPILALPFAKLGKKMKRRMQEGLEARADASEIFTQTIDGIATVKAQGMEDGRMTALASATEGIQKSEVRIARTRAKGKAFTDLAYGVALALTLGGGGWFVASGLVTTSPGEFIGILVAVAVVFRPVKRIGDAWQTWNQSLAAAERLFEVIDAPVDPALGGSTTPLAPLARRLSLRDVRFAYPGAPDEPVLRGVTLDIPAGKTLAIVGASGAGKSTIVQLLMRLYDPTEGAVLWDDIPLSTVSRRALLPQIAVVSQQAFLFNDTVEANIRVGRPDATDEALRDAAKKARVDEFIPRLAEGWNTRVGNRGAAISGGQAQRITIARAIVKDASLLLLDEATSNLDPESEALVQEALNNASKGRTTVVIAHRLTTIERADLIVVLDRGVVVETGTHAELLAAGGAYARMRNGPSAPRGLA